MSDFNVSIIMTLKERMIKPLKRVTGMLRELKSEAKNVTANLKRTTGELGKFSAKLLASAGVAAFAIKKMFVDPAAEMEQFQAILKNLEGSNEKAASSMKWIEEFTKKTPFQIAQVTDAFVKMRSLGLDPTDGLLETLGNTSSAMGKDINQAVEAIADAVTGENERLKEFGIKAKTDGGTVTYEFTDKDGLTRAIEVAKDDRQGIQDALAGIWDEKFAGSMADQMDTFKGKMSNLSDTWYNFRVRVMNSGVMDYLKTKLTELAVAFELWASNPQVTQQIARDLIAFFKGMVAGAKAIFEFTKALADFVGGWRELGFYALLAGLLTILSPVVVAVGALSFAVYQFGKAMLSTAIKAKAATGMMGSAGGGKGGGILGALGGGKGKKLGLLGKMKGAGPIGAILGALSVGSTLLDGDLTGTQKARSVTQDVSGLGGAFGGAKAGALAGALLGPLGSAIGGVLGGTLGYFAGDFLGGKAAGIFGDDRSPANLASQGNYAPLSTAGGPSQVDATYAPVFNINGSNLTKLDIEDINRRMMQEHQRSLQAKSRGVMFDA